MLAQAISSTRPTAPSSTRSGDCRVSDDHLLQRHHADDPAVVLRRETPGEPRADGIQLRLSLRHGNARLQPSGDLKPMARPSRHPARRRAGPARGESRPARLSVNGETKRRGHDPDDREGTLVQIDGASDDPGSAPNEPRHRSSLRMTTGGAPACRLPSEATRPARAVSPRSEKSSGVTTDVFTMEGSPRGRQRELVLLRSRHLAEGAGLLAQLGEVRIRPTRSRDALLWLRLEHIEQLLRMVVRQRLQQHGIDDAEDGSVRADAESEGEHGDGGEAGILAQHAQSEARVLHEGLDRGQALQLAVGFLELREPSEPQRAPRAWLPPAPCRAARLSSVSMSRWALELLIEVSIDAARRQPRASARDERPHPGEHGLAPLRDAQHAADDGRDALPVLRLRLEPLPARPG